MNSVNSIHWRLRQPRYRLIGSLCEQCGQPVFHSRRLCSACAELLRDKPAATKWDEATLILLPFETRSYAIINEPKTGSPHCLTLNTEA